MKIKMKKLTLLIFHSIREKFLSSLQDFGIVHLETNASVENEDIVKLKNQINILKKTEILLNKLGENINIKQEQYKKDIFDLVSVIEKEKKSLDDHYLHLEELEKDIDILAPWGKFDPENIKRLKDNGVFIKFFVTSKSRFMKMEKDFALEVISAYKGRVYFIVVYQGEWKEDIFAAELRIPIKSTGTIKKEMEKQEQRVEMQEDKTFKLTQYTNEIVIQFGGLP